MRFIILEVNIFDYLFTLSQHESSIIQKAYVSSVLNNHNVNIEFAMCLHLNMICASAFRKLFEFDNG